ncbi:Na(+)-translocating NADH-quinone reductase subunit A [Pontiella agarivorans]|uniref:Na(+)-translocating NADH-quinone reductase subunit A n=1 Tax=Pontiella agarivorans TaxID=3038953 RepID=A0ABU5N224_9BACT|nr:Na(+)-translocating NADH-quinone reductase subunit A [Pontiella agarivorans]MDZ8120487.1 Na(+)-translocating NADH-quinone reductase subunit A [Pontiella agarivorans]
MANFKIKKGFDVKVVGKPSANIEEYASQQLFTVYPSEFEGLKLRLKVKAGDTVKRGDVLFENKKNEKMVFRSPCAGTVKAINLGARRFPVEIQIEKDPQSQDRVTFETYTRDSVGQLSREQVADHLLNTGVWPLIKQRPFNKMADPDTAPKAVFINACNSAPFQADFSVVLKGDEEAFQTGINALAKLTEGKVHLCKSAGSDVPDFKNAESHTFAGKHPSGNTSVHINRISPILPHDTVYTVSAQDVILIGKTLLTGELPKTKIIALAGPAVKEEFRKYYKVEIAASLESLLNKAIEGDEVRLINGNILWGDKLKADTCVPFYGSEIFALEEDRSRHLMGWTMPGLFQYSAHRVNVSSFFGFSHDWKLGTSLHGSHRAMVVTGWLDKFQPLNIMTDFLMRAALAHDTDEMIQLGILETDPEDFALASFVDPHKTDICGIIKRGLEEIEEEGI